MVSNKQCVQIALGRLVGDTGVQESFVCSEEGKVPDAAIACLLGSLIDTLAHQETYDRTIVAAGLCLDHDSGQRAGLQVLRPDSSIRPTTYAIPSGQGQMDLLTRCARSFAADGRIKSRAELNIRETMPVLKA